MTLRARFYHQAAQGGFPMLGDLRAAINHNIPFQVGGA
jgi:hypothetical protein